jgi:hypothetical protein
MDQLGMGLLLAYRASEGASRLPGEPERRPTLRLRAPRRAPRLRVRRP